MSIDASLLPARGIVAVAGPDAPDLLNRLFTNSTLEMTRGEARYAAFLSPQGKLLYDFLVVAADGTEPTLLLDCVASQAADLAKRLNFQKLRAQVTVADRSAELGVAAVWGAQPQPADGLVVRDPRADALGWRVVDARDRLAASYPEATARYEAHRIRLAIPQGGSDFAYGDAFAHDANLDHLNGVDFKKGCYVGQEVVARVHFRKSARKRVVPVRFDTAPPAGAEIRAGDVSLGTIGSVAAGEGLALVRLDRLADAIAAGMPVTADGRPLQIAVPASFAPAMSSKAHV